jgi:hypothetical protein
LKYYNTETSITNDSDASYDSTLTDTDGGDGLVITVVDLDNHHVVIVVGDGDVRL